MSKRFAFCSKASTLARRKLCARWPFSGSRVSWGWALTEQVPSPIYDKPPKPAANEPSLFAEPTEAMQKSLRL